MRKKGIESKEHYETIKLLSERYNLSPIEFSNGTGKKYADLKMSGGFIEVETAVQKNKLKNSKDFRKDHDILLYLILPEEIEALVKGIVYISRDGVETIIK